MRPRIIPWVVVACGLNLLAGCALRSVDAPHTAATVSPLFSDQTAKAGISFVHTNGASGKFYYIEPMAGGCGFIDYDNDGWPDIILVQSGPSDSPGPDGRPHCALYHNNRNGKFTDVTAGSGLDKDLGYGMGVAVGDYDNDGFDDLFITAYHGNHLFHNERGTGKWTETTQAMGLGTVHSTGYATSAAFGDYDNDGRLDLYVCYYAPWTPETNKKCSSPRREPDYCTPEVYETETHQLFHNEGGRFVDVSERAGITKSKGRGLAAAFVDCDGDGRQDIFVANDISENMLWHNNGDGTFTNRALQAGVARDEAGRRMAAMGIGLADYDRSGRDSLFVTDFSNSPNTLFKSVGHGMFTDVSATSGVGPVHLKYLSFGCEFLDYDADGWPDLVTANGHVTVHIHNQFPETDYKEPDQLLHNEQNGTFREVADKSLLGELAHPSVSRGLAVADYDNDGRLDLLIVRQNESPLLLHNETKTGNHWISFRTAGTKSNRDGYHARISITAAGQTRVATVRAGSSYLSHSDSRVYFGLGKAVTVDSVKITWPSGKSEELHSLAPDRVYYLEEGKRISASHDSAR